MFIKVVLLLSGMVWVRATLPRIRYDHLMALGWKVLFPLALLAVAWTAISLAVAGNAPDATPYSIIFGIIFGLIVLGVIVQFWRRSRGIPPLDMTDARSGLGWAVIYALGALIAAPFALYDWAMKNRHGFEGFWDATRREQEERARKASEHGSNGGGDSS